MPLCPLNKYSAFCQKAQSIERVEINQKKITKMKTQEQIQEKKRIDLPEHLQKAVSIIGEAAAPRKAMLTPFSPFTST